MEKREINKPSETARQANIKAGQAALRRALPHEVELAKAIIEMRKNLPNA